MATTPGRVETLSNTDSFLTQGIQARIAQQPNGSSYSCEWTLTGAVKAIAMLVYSVFKFIVLGLYDYCIRAEDKVVAGTQQLTHPKLVAFQNSFDFFVRTFSFWAMFSGRHSAPPMLRTDKEPDDIVAQILLFLWMTREIKQEQAANPGTDLSRFQLDIVVCEGDQALIIQKAASIRKILSIGISTGEFAPELSQLVNIYLDTHETKLSKAKIEGFGLINNCVDEVLQSTEKALNNYSGVEEFPSANTVYDHWNKLAENDHNTSLYLFNLAPVDSLITKMNAKTLNCTDCTTYGSFNLNEPIERIAEPNAKSQGLNLKKPTAETKPGVKDCWQEATRPVQKLLRNFRNLCDYEGYTVLRQTTNHNDNRMGAFTDSPLYQALGYDKNTNSWDEASPLQKIILGAQYLWGQKVVGEKAFKAIQDESRILLEPLQQAVQTSVQSGTAYTFLDAQALAEGLSLELVNESGHKTDLGKKVEQSLSYLNNSGMQMVIADGGVAALMANPYLLNPACVTAATEITFVGASGKPNVQFTPPTQDHHGNCFAIESVGRPYVVDDEGKSDFVVTHQAISKQDLTSFFASVLGTPSA